MWEMYGYLSAVFDHPAAQFVALVTRVLSVMANRLDAQEVAQSTEQIVRFHCTTSG
jgi:hypothetical protein